MNEGYMRQFLGAVFCLLSLVFSLFVCEQIPLSYSFTCLSRDPSEPLSIPDDVGIAKFLQVTDANA